MENNKISESDKELRTQLFLLGFQDSNQHNSFDTAVWSMNNRKTKVAKLVYAGDTFIISLPGIKDRTTYFADHVIKIVLGEE